MALTKYRNTKFRADTLTTIEQANAICAEYADQGFAITLRQLYYQFVARGLLPENTQRQYNRIQSVCNDARMAGLMDWDYLIDRTRNLVERRRWDSPADMVKWSADQFHKDLWKPQKKRVEVWVEKDAAIGVIEGTCNVNDVPYFSSRGYTSTSEMYSAAQRIRWYIEAGEQVLILHIGDHDPSGVDMSRDIETRLREMIHQDWAGLHMGSGQWTRGMIRRSMWEHMVDAGNVGPGDLPADGPWLAPPWQVKRIALTMDQVQRYNPPPNFAKITDSRAEEYISKYGTESWELDALEPTVLRELIVNEIDAFRDEDLWDDTIHQMEIDRRDLQTISDRWNSVKEYVNVQHQ